MLAGGQLILAGPTLGHTNTGVAVFEAPDEDAAQQIMAADPAISSGYARRRAAPVPGVAAPRTRLTWRPAARSAAGRWPSSWPAGAAGRVLRVMVLQERQGLGVEGLDVLVDRGVRAVLEDEQLGALDASVSGAAKRVEVTASCRPKVTRVGAWISSSRPWRHGL